MYNMNLSKVLSALSGGLIIIVNLLQLVAPVLPTVWSNLITAVVAVFASYHLLKSHSDKSLMAGGYVKRLQP